jgi:hypothetical protein
MSDTRHASQVDVTVETGQELILLAGDNGTGIKGCRG